MAEIDLSLPVAAQPSLDGIVVLARAAEDHSYNQVWLLETWGRDAVTTTVTIAERTDSVGVSPNICNVYSRSPALFGQAAATLQELSGGRFRL